MEDRSSTRILTARLVELLVAAEAKSLSDIQNMPIATLFPIRGPGSIELLKSTDGAPMARRGSSASVSSKIRSRSDSAVSSISVSSNGSSEDSEEVARLLGDLNLRSTRQGASIVGPRQVSPFLRAMYSRGVPNLPLLEGMDDAYFKRIETLVNSVAPKLGDGFINATNWDMIQFINYYLTLGVYIRNDIFYHPRDPKARKEHDDDLTRWSLKLGAGEDTFGLRDTPILSNPPPADAARVKKMEDLTNTLRTTLFSVIELQPSLWTPVPGQPEKEVIDTQILWEELRKASSLDQLNSSYRRVLRNGVRSTAVLFEHFFDNRNWRRKAESILNKLPIPMVIMSLKMANVGLKVINPAPIIEQFLKMVLWAPTKNTHSIFQRIGSYVTDNAKTEREIAKLEKMLGKEICSEIKEVVSRNAESLLGRASDNRFARTLKREMNTTIARKHVQYARCLVRLKEKDDFIDLLADKDVIDLIVQLAKIAPIVLREFAKGGGDLSATIGGAFELVKKGMKVLDRYDQYRYTPDCGKKMGVNGSTLTASQYSELRESIIKDLEDLVLDFVKKLYPTVRALADSQNANMGLVRTVNWAIEEIASRPQCLSVGRDGNLYQNSRVGCGAERHALLDIMSPECINRIKSKLSRSDLTTLDEEIAQIETCIAKGVDVSLWPVMPIIEEKLLPAFAKDVYHALTGF